MMTKAQMLLKEVIFVHHPEVARQSHLQKFLYTRASWINTECMVEETMAEVGGYRFVDGEHEDFEDGTDCKTASVSPTGRRGASHRVEISGVGRGGPGGSVKKGALRVVLYNPVSQSLSYYFIPKAAWLEMLAYHPTTGIAKIVGTWNRETGMSQKLSRFEVGSFTELAQRLACEATRTLTLSPNTNDGVEIRRFD